MVKTVRIFVAVAFLLVALSSSATSQQLPAGDSQKNTLRYGVLVDCSGSMRQDLGRVIAVGRALVNNSKQTDEGFIISFTSSDRINLLHDFTLNKRSLISALEDTSPESGQTALYDAVYLAADHLVKQTPAATTVRVLFIISDGEDRNSKSKSKEVQAFLIENKIKLFALGLTYAVDGTHGTSRDKAGRNLSLLADETGGQAFIVKNRKDFEAQALALIEAVRGL